MGKENLSYWDYVKAAFNWKVRTPTLGWMPLNKFALAGFAILGFGHPAFWLLGLAYEAGYLMWLPGSERFQKLVRATRQAAVTQEWGEKEQEMLARLDADSRARYTQLADRCWRILRQGRSGEKGAGLEELQAADLNHLLWIFLNLLQTRRNIQAVIGQVSRADLEAELQNLTRKLAQEQPESAVGRSLKGILEIQQRRLENLAKATDGLKVTEAELYRIENQINLIQEEAAITRDPEVLSARLDGVVKSLQGTTEWMSENMQLFNALDAEAPPSTLMPGPPPPQQQPISKKTPPKKIAE